MIRLDRIDPISFGATPTKITPEGFRHYEGTATIGDVVLPYAEPSAHLEFRPADEVLSDAAIETMVGKPLTFEHPSDLLNSDTAKEHTEGTVLRAWREGTHLRVEVVVFTRDLQDAIEGGKVELSPGYKCDPTEEAGAFQGQKFHVVQRGHRYNHLAVVDRARTRTPTGEVARLDKDDTTMENEAPEGEQVGEKKDAPAAIPEISEAGNALFAQLPPDDQKIILAWKAAASGEVAEEMALAEGKSLEEAEAIEENTKAAAGGEGEEPEMEDNMQMMDMLKALDARLAKMEAAGGETKKDSQDPPINAGALAAMQAKAVEVAVAAVRQEGKLLKMVRTDSADLLKGDDATAAFEAMGAEVKRSLPDLHGVFVDNRKANRLDAAVKIYTAAVSQRRRAVMDADIDNTLGGVIEKMSAGEDAGDLFTA
jgi:hypothetical protein